MKSEFGRIGRCELTDLYESAVVLRQVLQVRWRDAGGVERQQRLQPLDLQTRDGSEYLLARDPHGSELSICIDDILGVREFDPGGR